jgi:hypothetical protein
MTGEDCLLLESLAERDALAAGHGLPEVIAALDRLREDFHWELELLIVKFGQAAVDKAIDAMPQTWPSVSLH